MKNKKHCCNSFVKISAVAQQYNIAKSEQSSHTPGGSHHRRLRPYHFNFLERKKNSTHKGTDKQYVADSFINSIHVVEIVINEVCTKFQNTRSSSSWEIFDENFHIHYTGERERKSKI